MAKWCTKGWRVKFGNPPACVLATQQMANSTQTLAYSLLVMVEYDGEMTMYRVPAEAVPERVRTEIDRIGATTPVYNFGTETHKWLSERLDDEADESEIVAATIRPPGQRNSLGEVLSGDFKIIILMGTD
jgi:hypothetical protein